MMIIFEKGKNLNKACERPFRKTN